MLHRALATLILSLLLINQSNAQQKDTTDHYCNQIDILYSLSHLGHQVLINYNQHWGRHALVIGLTYFLDSKVAQPYSRFNDWQFSKPESYGFLSRVGLSLGYEMHLFKRFSSHIDSYIFGQLQHENYIVAAHPDIASVSEGPFTIVGAVAGIGVQRDIYTNLSFNASTGIGSALFIDDGVRSANPPVGTFEKDFSERVVILRLGLSYHLR